jgi:hypothetical protein
MTFFKKKILREQHIKLTLVSWFNPSNLRPGIW